MTFTRGYSNGDALSPRESRLNIWLITVGEPLPLSESRARLWRTGTLARLLVSRGHKVTWWTSTVDHFTKEYFARSNASVQIDDNLELQFLHGELYRKNISISGFATTHRSAAPSGVSLPSVRHQIWLCAGFPPSSWSLRPSTTALREGFRSSWTSATCGPMKSKSAYRACWCRCCALRCLRCTGRRVSRCAMRPACSRFHNGISIGG